MATNGRLDLNTLMLVDGWAYLAPNTAASWNAACAVLVSMGYPRPTITSPDGAYRTYERQVYWKNYWTSQGKPQNAATPGTSNHGWGTAVDIANVAKFYRPDLVRIMKDYGFTFNVPSENWHVQHDGSKPPITYERERTLRPYLNIQTKELAVGGAGVWVVVPPQPVPAGNGLAIVRDAFGVETPMHNNDYNYIKSVCLSGVNAGVAPVIDYDKLAKAINVPTAEENGKAARAAIVK